MQNPHYWLFLHRYIFINSSIKLKGTALEVGEDKAPRLYLKRQPENELI